MSLFARETLSGPSPGPHLLITGGVHGDEFEPMAAIRRLRSELQGQVQRGRVTLVPLVNEPAFRRGQRIGPDGLDLARTCPGDPAGSITEKIAAELSDLIRTADHYVDLHTGGTRLQVLPLSGYMLHPDLKVLEISRQMSRLMDLPLIWGTDPGLDGRSLSVARDAGVPAIYAEYLGGGLLDPRGVEAYVGGCLNILSWLEMIPRPLPPLGMPRVVEDARPGSGHMQVNHPAPCEGFFAPAVRLGQDVSEGELLGTVCDPLGLEPLPVLARYAGRVIVLHTFSRIDENTSVAVLLQMEPPWGR